MSARKTPPQKKDETYAEYLAFRAIRWIGSIESLIFHTAGFIISFMLYFLGVNFNTILLVVTTVLSLEAVYLSIFAQMTLNRHSDELEDIQEDVGDIQEDVEEIQEDVDEIQEDVDEIQKDVDEIQEDVEEIQDEEEVHETHVMVDPAMLSRIEQSLRELGTEIAEMKRRGK